MSGRPLPTTAASPLLARLERQIRRGLARGSEVRDVGAFRLYLWPRPEPFYRNRALPVAAAPGGDWRPAVAAMLAAFAAAGREPRLEFFADRWPGLAATLEVAGLRRELEAPVMTAETAPPALSSDPARNPGGVRLLGPGVSRATRQAFLAGAQAAFGHGVGPPDPGEVEQLGRDLDEGATLAAARFEGEVPVAGASLIGIGAEAELAGVWTAPGHRRRGHAAAVCAALMRRFFAAGGELVWLTAGGEGSEPLYRGLGFERVGTQLDYGPPAREA